MTLNMVSLPTLQAAWRAWRSCKQHKAAVRASWQETFGERGEGATRWDLALRLCLQWTSYAGWHNKLHMCSRICANLGFVHCT